MREKVVAGLHALGADIDLLTERGLPLFEDAAELALAHISRSGREHFLIPEAARQWRRMRAAADAAGVVLVMISGFRSFDRQRQIIEERLAAGEPIEEILTVLAPPGCSEHHSGRAVDVGTPGGEPLSESFERTDAFRWLVAEAASFGFGMSYPRGNASGYRYEPWHWCYGS